MKYLILILTLVTISKVHAGEGKGVNAMAASFTGNSTGLETAQIKFQDFTQNGELIFDIKGRDAKRIQRYRVLESDQINEQVLDALEQSFNNNKMWQNL